MNPFKWNTQQHSIAALLLQGKSREQVFNELLPLVQGQIVPMIFCDTSAGYRRPLPVYDQIPLLFYHIGRVRGKIEREYPHLSQHLCAESSHSRRNYGNRRWRAQFYANAQAQATEPVVNEPVNEPAVSVSDPEPEPVSEPVVIEPGSFREKVAYLERRIIEIRDYCKSKKVGNREFDFVSTRAFRHGIDALCAGIEVDDFLWSIGASWPEENRVAAGLNYTVDYDKYAIEGTNRLLGFVIRLLSAGIPVYLVGPTGSGKSYLARELADYLQVNYGEIPLSLGVSRSDLLGAYTPDGYKTRPLIEMYKAEGDGGLFCYEEIDACDPNVLLTVNNAIANAHLFNSVTGETLDRHERHMPMATANTFGNGATSNFSAREGLDGSTLDRFKYGRVWVDYNPDIEHEILWSDFEAKEAEYLNNALQVNA